jgi:hypothetical protein
MSGKSSDYVRQNKPVPASYFPKSLTVVDASQELPDMFHTSRGIIVFSERARAVAEAWSPGEVEFIPVSLDAKPEIQSLLRLASAYYFINVLARAQRFQWLDIPVQAFPPQEDGVQRFASRQNYHQWKLHQRAPDDPLIWHESWWRIDKKEYRGHVDILVEDIWQELDANFPDQLNALKVGE